jgi:hypothetical protein
MSFAEEDPGSNTNKMFNFSHPYFMQQKSDNHLPRPVMMPDRTSPVKAHEQAKLRVRVLRHHDGAAAEFILSSPARDDEERMDAAAIVFPKWTSLFGGGREVFPFSRACVRASCSLASRR